MEFWSANIVILEYSFNNKIPEIKNISLLEKFIVADPLCTLKDCLSRIERFQPSIQCISQILGTVTKISCMLMAFFIEELFNSQCSEILVYAAFI